MDRILTQLPKTQFSGLEFSNIVEDIYNLIKQNPNYNANWSDFLNSNAGRMLVEVFAYIADQLATRIDWNVNENFIGTATQRTSIIRLLKLIGYNFSLPVSSQVDVSAKFSIPVGKYTIKPAYTEGSGVFITKTLTAQDLKGKSRTYEAIDFDASSSKFNYKTEIILDTGTELASKLNQSISFFEGVTKVEDLVANSADGQRFTLGSFPVARNSVRVYLLTQNGSDIRETELLNVDNFLDPKAQLTGSGTETYSIPYVINVTDNDSVQVEFGSTSLLPTADRRLPQGSTIRVFYRIGGGADGDLVRLSLQTTESITYLGSKLEIVYSNNSAGVGGEDSETLDHAKYFGPLKMRTAGKTVTEEDYDIILSSNTKTLLSKSYGIKNMPGNFYSKYGMFINPLDVWNFIVMKKSGWDSIPTYNYKYADFGTFNLENQFNGKYAFNSGSFGNSTALKKSNVITYSKNYDYDNLGGRVFNNYVVLKTPDKFKTSIYIPDPINPGSYIANPKMIGSITNTKYDKVLYKNIRDIPNHLVVSDNLDNYFYGDYNKTGIPRLSIQESIHAYYESPIDGTSGFDISGGKNKFILNVDNRCDVLIDLSRSGISPSFVPITTQGTIKGVVEIINESVSSAYGVVAAYQDFGILIPDTSAQVLNLENADEELWDCKISDIIYKVDTGVTQSYTAMLAALNATIGPMYHADFIQNKVNVLCYDIRVTAITAPTVVLQESFTQKDFLVAMGATPLKTTAVPSGSYNNIASVVVRGTSKFLKLTSPNSGINSYLVFKQPLPETSDCSINVFNLNFAADEVIAYTCYGNKTLTIIYKDQTELDFANFIYENGSIGFTPDDRDFVFLNYITDEKNTIKLGSYFNEAYDSSSLLWREVPKTIYNAVYTLDETDSNGIKEFLDVDLSNFQLRFTSNETDANSLFVIPNDYNLLRATNPKIKTLEFTADLMFALKSTGNLKMQVNSGVAKTINLSFMPTLQSIIDGFNDAFDADCGKSVADLADPNKKFAVLDLATSKITLTSFDKKEGQIIIFSGGTNDCSNLLFSGLTGSETTIKASGDYYLEYDVANECMNMVKLENSHNIPDLDFYIHFIVDNRWIPKDTRISKKHTDEDDYLTFMKPYKITGVENTFRRPVFKTFDVTGTIYISTAFPLSQVRNAVSLAIKNTFSLSKANFNKAVRKSEIISVVLQIPGVRYMEITFFGTNSLDESTNVLNTIPGEFDTLIVVSDDVFDASGNQLHGCNFTYNSI